MSTRSTKRNGLARVDDSRGEPITMNGVPGRATSRRAESSAPGAAEPGSRPSLEELFRTLVRDELRPFFDMIHQVLERIGRGASDEFLSVPEAAKFAHVGKSTVRGWIKTKRLRAGKAGRLIRIRRSDLNALITERRDDQQPDPETEAAKILERNRPTER